MKVNTNRMAWIFMMLFIVGGSFYVISLVVLFTAIVSPSERNNATSNCKIPVLLALFNSCYPIESVYNEIAKNVMLSTPNRFKAARFRAALESLERKWFARKYFTKFVSNNSTLSSTGSFLKFRFVP